MWQPWKCAFMIFCGERRVIDFYPQFWIHHLIHTEVTLLTGSSQPMTGWHRTTSRRCMTLMGTLAWGVPLHCSVIFSLSLFYKSQPCFVVFQFSQPPPAFSSFYPMGVSHSISFTSLILSWFLLLRVPGLRQHPTVIDIVPSCHEVNTIFSSIGKGSDIWFFPCGRLLSVTLFFSICWYVHDIYSFYCQTFFVCVWLLDESW